MLENYFAVQAEVIARLREQLPDVREVRAMSGSDDAKEMVRAAPAVYVSYAAEEVVTGLGGKALGGQAIVQYWLVLLVVRSTRELREGSGLRDQAGPLLARINGALLDWKPGEPFSPMEKSSAPSAEYGNGLGYFPQVFTTRLPVRGQLVP